MKSQTIDLSSYQSLTSYLYSRSVPVSYINDLFRASAKFGISLEDATSKGQLASKVWLSETLSGLNVGAFYHGVICGGWYGTLIPILLHWVSVRSLTTIDIDESCLDIVPEVVNSAGNRCRIFAQAADMHRIDYSEYDLIINTSSEHINSISGWLSSIPSGKLIVVQNNDLLSAEGHINCKASLEELYDETSQHLNILYSGQMVMPEYTRFMICGVTK